MTSRLERLIKLDLAIRKGDYPGVAELCAICEVQQRTLFQDLRELRENLGCDIRYDRAKRGYYNASPDKRLPTFALTNEELLMIAVAAELLSQSAGEAMARVLQSAITKIQDGYRQKIEISAENLKQFIRTNRKSTSSLQPAQIVGILEALRQTKLLQVTDEQNLQATETVKPYCLMIFNGEWELVGYSCETRAVSSRPLAEINLQLHPNGKHLQQPLNSDHDLEKWIEMRVATSDTQPVAKGDRLKD